MHRSRWARHVSLEALAQDEKRRGESDLRHQSRASGIAQKLVVEAGQPKPEGYSDWKKLLASKDVDAVVSAVPVYLHAPCYLDTIAAGKDIYAEKPLSRTWAECETVMAAVSGSKVFFQIGYQRRADPHFLESIAQVHRANSGGSLRAG